MQGFTWEDGKAVTTLSDEERTVFARIAADVGMLISGEQFGLEIPNYSSIHDDDFDLEKILSNLEHAVADPDDPALLKLFPRASKTDTEAAQEFRRLTEEELRHAKNSRLKLLWQQLSEEQPRWEIDGEQLADIAGALTDIRTVLSARLGIETDADAEVLHQEIELAEKIFSGELGEEDEDLQLDRERVWLGMLYEAATWLQSSLVEVMVQQHNDQI